jgi:hypothetical protein
VEHIDWKLQVEKKLHIYECYNFVRSVRAIIGVDRLNIVTAFETIGMLSGRTEKDQGNVATGLWAR